MKNNDSADKIVWETKIKKNIKTKNNLQNFLNQKGNLPPIFIDKIFKQLNEAFKELLENKIAYREINPSNILRQYNENDSDDETKINFTSIF